MSPSSELSIGLNKSAAFFQHAEDGDVRAEIYKNYITNPKQRMTFHPMHSLNQDVTTEPQQGCRLIAPKAQTIKLIALHFRCCYQLNPACIVKWDGIKILSVVS